MAPAAKTEKKLSPQETAQKEALAFLRQAGEGVTGEDDIVFEGTKIILPATMKDIDEGIKFLRQRRDDEEQKYGFQRTYAFRPLDGAHAVAVALKRAFGQSVGKTIQTMFGPVPPRFVDVEIGPNGKMTQVPQGAMTIPGLDGVTIFVDSTTDKNLGPLFFLHGEGPRKYRHEVEGFFNLVQQVLLEESIYRGHAVDGQTVPHFLDLSGIDPDNVVYTDDVFTQLDANVWSPIKHADALARQKLPGKRAVLFAGPYGTGKTLAAYLTARICVENKWTFFMVRPGRDDLGMVLQTAKMYQPSAVFFEDLDTVGSAASGDKDHMSEVLDLFDGIESKGLKMLLVLTTNNVQDLHPGMLRPGRLDAVITIDALDRPSVEKLARQLIGESLHKDVDFDRVFEANAGYPPAFVSEGLHRAIRYAVAENDGLVRTRSITTDHLVNAADGLRHQFELMKGADPNPPEESIGAAFGRLVSAQIEGKIGETKLRRIGAPNGELELYVEADAPS